MQENFPSTNKQSVLETTLQIAPARWPAEGKAKEAKVKQMSWGLFRNRWKPPRSHFLSGLILKFSYPPSPIPPSVFFLNVINIRENVLVCTSFKSSTIAIYSFLWSTALIFISAIFLLFGRLPFLVGISFYLVYPHMATPGPCVRWYAVPWWWWWWRRPSFSQKSGISDCDFLKVGS